MKKSGAKRAAISAAGSELVEVVDGADRPLAAMPLDEVHRQLLFHRAVFVLLYDLPGRLFLQKRSRMKRIYPGRWDLSATGHVQAGESMEEAAIRELKEELGVEAADLRLLHEIAASQDTGFEFLSLFTVGKIAFRPRPNAAEIEDGMFITADELAYLASQYREMLTPGLVFFWQQGFLFPLD